MTSWGGQSGGSVHKITKARGKMVKPILKKLSHSEKNSLDLDRGWDEQQVEQLEVFGYGYAGQARDVSFGFAGGAGFGGAAGDGTTLVVGGGSGIRASLKFQHGRSGSQTSAGSGPPRAAFVHPFAQTPRTSTPPVSYANSLASFDNGRDCSPTITENEDDDGFDTGPTTTYPHSHMHAHAHSHSHSQPPPASASQSNLRRPSLNSQRTASFPETSASNPPSLRINTGGRSVSATTTATSSRLAQGTPPSYSHSDLHLNSHGLSVSVTDTLDSPTGSLGGGSVIGSHQSQQQQQQSQLSPLRTSLDMGTSFPRLRSRSELDTARVAENIRIARRKFEERERAKEEKHDREMIRQRERRFTKEAERIEKGETPGRPSMHRRKTPTGLSTVSEPGLKSSKTDLATHSTPHFGFSAPTGSGSTGIGIGIGLGRRRHTDSPAATAKGENLMGFEARRYESVSLQTPPSFGVTVDDVRFGQSQPRRGSGTKRRTQGYWQGFLLWLRTKLLRMGAR
ncbi:hypothetical protein C8A00DRAFT_31623 [Chaetomidium leptoderma]|uniref:Uncharacterized protein n=1 Tax=Chaetomidium leptoderma TaxID=669021 RepID=A0AAN6VPU1_9PEZI|nr:hypothetical protein C8A00DRAFT_31623 [Chaetomidium leptoderma]